MGNMILTIVGSLLAVSIAIVAVVFLVVPLFKGIRWLVVHLFRFVTGIVGDLLRVIGSILTALVFAPLIVLNVIIGRWSASAHYGRGFQAELRAMGQALYRLVIGHPARFLLLTPLIEGIEQRVPDAMAKAPGADKPSRRTGLFEGYEIVGSLQGGGSGGRLYIAKPDAKKLEIFRRARQEGVTQVVIKSFSLADGSSLPQIIRESRALEAARKLGLILDHELTDERFFYAMRYIPGEDLTTITKRLHAEAGVAGLAGTTLASAMGYLADLLTELDLYHRGGLWHKDVKPDNIIISSARAHLVDFGLITPLRSAMTLTTHGTEYFRDPEMVRMALRGAKVNEVDGVKFDLYGVGAVLYSVIENSFPAHGALSQISKSCPETLRWIVRRLMADLQHRYPSAQSALADLRVVMSAADPFALKPIDLPSVRGGDSPHVAHHQPEPFTMPPAQAAAGNPDPRGFVFQAEIGMGSHPQQAREFRVAPAPGTPGGPTGRRRPRLVIADWFTGKYTSAGNSPFEPGVRPAPGTPEPFPAQAARKADEFANAASVAAASFARSAEPHVRKAAGTAAEQLARAQDRVRRAQERAAHRRGKRSPYAARAGEYNNRPNLGVLGVSLGFVGLVLGAVFGVIKSASNVTDSGSPSEHDPSHTISINLDTGRGEQSFSITPNLFDAQFTVENWHAEMESPPVPDEAMSTMSPMAPDAPPAPALPMPRIRAVIEPVEDPVGTLLVVDSLPIDLNPEGRAKLVWLVEHLNQSRFSILGLGDGEQEIALLARAKGLIGLAQPGDNGARAALRRWLDDHENGPRVDALLWATTDPEQPLRVFTREGYDHEPLEEAIRTTID